MLKNGKARGKDEITAELLKVDTDKIVNWLADLFDTILETETLPKTWKHCLIVKLPKKGDLGEAS